MGERVGETESDGQAKQSQMGPYEQVKYSETEKVEMLSLSVKPARPVEAHPA
jgi:hypothetical protein